jgi:hypothetical protein
MNLDRHLPRPSTDLGLLLLEAHALDATGERDGATRGDHGLRGDAVPQVGGTTDDVALDERDLCAEARGVRGCGVAGGATADDHETSRHDRRGYPRLCGGGE